MQELVTAAALRGVSDKKLKFPRKQIVSLRDRSARVVVKQEKKLRAQIAAALAEDTARTKRILQSPLDDPRWAIQKPFARQLLGVDPKHARATALVRARMPTYITLKDVKKRWGKGQEYIFPITQFEKLWGDMTALPELECRYVAVPRFRGQQIKEPAQLDGWLRDGSAAYLESLCEWK